MMDLSCNMIRLLRDAPETWAPLPTGVWCGNRTLLALENRKLITTGFNVAGCGPGWRWRLTTRGRREQSNWRRQE